MGYQLWTSPVTGYRRRGTRLSELRALVSAGITVDTILEPLQSCPAHADATDIASLLRVRDFDVAGVQNSQNEAVIGFVDRESLQSGQVKDHMQQLDVRHLVSAQTPLQAMMNVLKDRPFAFVLVGSQVRGIVTRADLNKPPARLYLFGMLSLLEMHLGYWIWDAYPGDTWKNDLPEGRLNAAEKILEQRGQGVTLFECLQFCDKRVLALAREDVRETMGIESKGSGEKRLKRAEKLRDLLSHSQYDLARDSSWGEVVATIEWMDTLLNRSDSEVDRRVADALERGDDGGLWTSA